jgi:hypothetical protein
MMLVLPIVFFFVQVPSGSMSSSAPLLTCERKMESTQNELKLWLCDGTVSARCGMEHVDADFMAIHVAVEP